MAMATIGKTSEITIFTHYAGKDGQGTLMFYDCEIIDEGDPCDLAFTYISRATGKKKEARFCTSEIAGFSYARD